MRGSKVLGSSFLLAIALAIVPASAAGAAVQEDAGALWALSVVPDNPNWPDTNSVELGVRFTTSEDLSLTGVRFYKGDLNVGTHFGTLWTEDGTMLATGEFTDETADGWQDLVFDAPVAIVPGPVYVASYWAPNGSYAATNDFFADQEVAIGPITALRAVGADGNGVFSYSETSTFPEFSYRNTNYWVTPLWADAASPAGDEGDGGDEGDEGDGGEGDGGEGDGGDEGDEGDGGEEGDGVSDERGGGDGNWSQWRRWIRSGEGNDQSWSRWGRWFRLWLRGAARV